MKIENINRYFEWYANWMDFNNSTIEAIKEGKYGNPFSLLNDWLEHVALSGNEAIGKLVYYSVQQHSDTELTSDCWLDGVKASISFDGAYFLNIEIDGTIFIPSNYSKDLIILDTLKD